MTTNPTEISGTWAMSKHRGGLEIDVCDQNAPRRSALLTRVSSGDGTA